MFAFDLQTFLIILKLLLKQLYVRADFFNTGNLHKNLCKLTLKYIIDRLRPRPSKNSSLSLNLFSNSPCFPTISMIFQFAPFKRTSYFFAKDTPPRISANNPLRQKLLILMKEVLFLLFQVSFSFSFFSSHCATIN